MPSISQLEREIIHMRKHEGIELVKKEGGVTENQIRKIINVSRTLLYKKYYRKGTSNRSLLYRGEFICLKLTIC